MVTGLEISSRDSVVHAVIDRGEGNALTTEMCTALTDFLEEPPPEAHVLVLSARGAAFCLGREREAQTVDDLRVEVDALVGLNQALTGTRLVTVAQVQGDAAGFGVGLAALCDVTVAAPSARFWFPEVELGLAPTVVLAWLPRIVGRKCAMQLTATGRKITAAAAAGLGLVTRVADDDAALDAAVKEEVADLVGHSPRVHARIRGFLNATADLTEAQAYDLATEQLILGSMQRTP